MISYTPKAAKAMAFLKRPYNDIDIFVEDTTNQNMWLELIKKIVPKNIRITSVNRLGGRNSVVNACKMDQRKGLRPKIYIIDGDFDFLAGTAKPRLKFLYRLSAYCVENLLINNQSIVEVGTCARPDMTEADISVRFGFRDWADEIRKAFEPLFVMYAVCRQLCPEVPTISFPVQKLICETRDGPCVSRRKVWRRLFEIARTVRHRCGLSLLRARRQEVANRSSSLELQHVVSGKDYIMPLLHLRLCRLFNFKGTQEQLKVYLAKFWQPSTEPQLTRRIRTLII